MKCERVGCDALGRSYQRYGSTIYSPAVSVNFSSALMPEQPITLCAEHSMESFGWAVTSAWGDPA